MHAYADEKRANARGVRALLIRALEDAILRRAWLEMGNELLMNNRNASAIWSLLRKSEALAPKRF
jgi:hypothetical protein